MVTQPCSQPCSRPIEPCQTESASVPGSSCHTHTVHHARPAAAPSHAQKGLCAYAAHAEALGYKDERVDAFVAEALAFLASPASAEVGGPWMWVLCRVRVLLA